MNTPKVPSASLDVVTTGQSLMADTLAIPGIIAGIFERAVHQVNQGVTQEAARSIGRILLSGVGDLYHASLATEYAFERLTGIPTFAMPSMRCGLYQSVTATDRDLIFQMSFSGRPDRVVEACGLAKQRGARVWAVALDEESPLARAADASFGDMGVPIDGAGFQLAHLVLALIAIRVAELRGSIPAAFAGELRAALHCSVADMERTLEQCGVAAAEAALASPDAGHVLFLGSGPGYGAAANGAARVVEAAGWNSSALDIEEWAHLNRFVAERRSPSVFIVPPGPSRPRAIEILAAASRLGKPTIVVADERDAELGGWGAYWLPVSTGLPEELCGIVYNLPGEVLANQISIAANRRPYCQDDPLYSQLGEVRWGGYIERTLPRSSLLESRSSGVSSQ